MELGIGVAVSIGSNATSLLVQRGLSSVTEKLSVTNERLSSGQRINRASDDAAGLAISSSLHAGAKVFAQALRNVNDAVSCFNIAEGALGALSHITTREMELAEQAANGSYTLQQRRAMDNEANALVDEFNRIVQSTEFNGRKILDFGQTGSSDLRVQAGYGKEGSLNHQTGSGLGRNVGSGAFSLQASITSNSSGSDFASTASVVLGDVNGDGTLDLLAGGGHSYMGYGDGQVKIFLNNGGGQLALGTTVVSNSGTRLGWTQSIVTGDVNGDGNLDLMAGGYSWNEGFSRQGQTRIFINDGKGNFSLKTTITSNFGSFSSKTESLAAGDVNGDGFLDLIASGTTYGGQNQGQTKIFLNDGCGNFVLGATITSNYGTSASKTKSVTLGDVNGDGTLDLVTAGFKKDSGAYQGETRVFLNDGRGGFTLRAAITSNKGATDNYTWGATLCDVNSDGCLDMMTAGMGDDWGETRVLLNQGNGDFVQRTALTTNYGIFSYSIALAAADMNGDGYADLVAGGHGGDSGQTTLFLNDGRGNFTLRSVFTSNSDSSDDAKTRSIAVGDVNGDGVNDILAGGDTYNYIGQTMVLFGAAVKTSNAAHVSLLSGGVARQALKELQAQLSRISNELGSIGGFQRRLETELGNLASLRENYLSAESRIIDVDVASESAELVRQQILQETVSAVLAQANQQPQIALRLLEIDTL